jgi:hypothetical protein
LRIGRKTIRGSDDRRTALWCVGTRPEARSLSKTFPLYGPVLYTVMSALFLGLFVLNVFTDGTMLGLISTGGLAVLMGYLASRAWTGKREKSQQ